MSHFSNAYADPDRAAAYAVLGFPATYTLAFRDLPALLAAHVRGHRALDFGCGAGRSSRFLHRLGFDVTGVDIAEPMLRRARELEAGAGDGAGDRRHRGRCVRYLLIDDDPSALPEGPFDLILAAYPFDNIPGGTHRAALFRGLRSRLVAPAGRLVLIASSPELYVHEWATFTTAAFPENASAGSGDRVRIVIKEAGDPRPVDDFRWFDRDYRSAFRNAGLELLETRRPVATGEEPFAWVSEREVPPWAIYVTGPGHEPVGR